MATVSEVLNAPPINKRSDYVGHPQWRAEAAIRALRNTGRHTALLSDTAPVKVQGETYDGGAMGSYTPGYDEVVLSNKGYTVGSRDTPVVISQPEMENTAAHELTHSLQGPERRAENVDSLRQSPQMFTLPMIHMLAGQKGINADAFRRTLGQSKENYGPGELGARFASELGYGADPYSDVVKEAYNKWPGLSMVYAQKNMQPNRPFPKHYKGEPEWTDAEKKAFKKTGERPFYSDEELVNIQQARINALRNVKGE